MGGENTGVNIGESGSNLIASIADWQLDAGHYTSANELSGTTDYPLEIYQPQAGGTTTSRFYKAFPGFEYNVRVAVAWGSYPYHFELDTAPSGMTINSSTGEISWPNPQESGTPYSVTANVYDQENRVVPGDTVSWTITVETTGFLFIDAVNGTSVADGGTGTRANPFLTLNDLYGGADSTKTTTSYPDNFVYFRAGTYEIDTVIGATNSDSEWRGDFKPIMWLAHPGETPEIDAAALPTDTYLNFQVQGGHQLYLDGFDFNCNSSTRGLMVNVATELTSLGTVVRNNTLRGQTLPGPTNTSLLFYSGGQGSYNHVADNIFVNSVGYGILGYGNPNTVIEDNEFQTDITKPVSPKSGNVDWTVRQNTMTETISAADDGNIFLQNYGSGDRGEFCYNNIRCASSTTDNAVAISHWTDKAEHYFYRNTFYGIFTVYGIDTSTGPYYINTNVIINNTGGDGIEYRPSVSEADKAQIVVTNNLVGSEANNIIDANGDLTPAYSIYEGTHGHNIS